MILDYLETSPSLDPKAWIAPDAVVIGDVGVAEEASVWFQSVVRGDVSHIRIGARTNIQDHCTIHVTRDGNPTIIGAEVSVGHRVVLHGCRVHDRALVGIGSILLDDSVVEEGAIVAAMTLLPPGMVVPAGKVAMGQPAKIVRDVREEERRWMAETVDQYVGYARNYARPGP